MPASGILLRAWRILNARLRPRSSSPRFALLCSSSLSPSSAPSAPPATKSSAPGSIALDRSRSAYEAMRRVVDDVVCRLSFGKAEMIISVRFASDVFGWYDANDSGSLWRDIGLISMGSEAGNAAFPRDHRMSLELLQPSSSVSSPTRAGPSSVSSGIRAPGTPFRRLLTNNCQALLFRFHALRWLGVFAATNRNISSSCGSSCCSGYSDWAARDTKTVGVGREATLAACSW